ncbi:MAG: 2-polyprenyl-3-methyl-6-methoxy-1,4-benzoquinone monooxygenase [Pseudomonadota bacterium]
MRHFSHSDRLLASVDGALRTLWGRPQARRPQPAAPHPATALTEPERRLAGALMRVNHVGEVCAQALYQAQALATPTAALKAHFQAAAQEEEDHLAWTQQRIEALGTHTSWLNPLWYAGSFALGWLAGRTGDALSLGFVVETERQVEAHLDEHLSRLPANDLASRAIVAQMKRDEAHHAVQAEEAGAQAVPKAVQHVMRATAKVMTTTAHWV